MASPVSLKLKTASGQTHFPQLCCHHLMIQLFTHNFMSMSRAKGSCAQMVSAEKARGAEGKAQKDVASKAKSKGGGKGKVGPAFRLLHTLC